MLEETPKEPQGEKLGGLQMESSSQRPRGDTPPAPTKGHVELPHVYLWTLGLGIESRLPWWGLELEVMLPWRAGP